MRPAILAVAAFALLLWLLHFIDAQLLPADIKPGVYPRTVAGLIGVALAPLVHGSFAHLISNTMSLLMLGASALYFYPRASRVALPVLYFAPGVGVWLFAREAYHIGASGLTYGLMFFLLVIGVKRKDRASVGISAAILFLYSGTMAGLLPEDSDISFEYHLFGALAGAACGVALRARDPQPPAEKDDWEDDDGDDPIIGDQWRMTDTATVDAPASDWRDNHPDDLYAMDAEDALLDAEWYEAEEYADGDDGDGIHPRHPRVLLSGGDGDGVDVGDGDVDGVYDGDNGDLDGDRDHRHGDRDHGDAYRRRHHHRRRPPRRRFSRP